MGDSRHPDTEDELRRDPTEATKREELKLYCVPVARHLACSSFYLVRARHLALLFVPLVRGTALPCSSFTSVWRASCRAFVYRVWPASCPSSLYLWRGTASCPALALPLCGTASVLSPPKFT